jgi:C-terminal processing protease CtpA/Prc
MNPHSFRDMQVQTRGEFGGLGIEVTMEEGLIKVVAPMDDKAIKMALDLLRGTATNAAFPPKPKAAVHN